MNREVQRNYCGNNTKLNFTIEACFIQKTARTAGDTLQLKTQIFFFKRARTELRPNDPFLPYYIEVIKNEKGPGSEINTEQDFIFSF